MPESFATPDEYALQGNASDLNTGLEQSLGAQAGEAFMGGVRTITRASQMLGAKYGFDPLAAAGAAEAGPAGMEIYNKEMQGLKDQPDISITDAKARIKQEGLEGRINLPQQDSIRQPVLDLMLDHAHEQATYDAAVNRGPQGFLPGALGFITQMGVGMIDLVNAAAFSIPVTGEARYGQLIAKAGESLMARAGVRAGVGAAQGAVGGAALLPADWWLKTQDGQDYTYADALKSVVLSAGMGAGFMGGHGVLADLLRRYRGLPLSGSPEDLLMRGLTRPRPEVANAIIPLEEVPGITASEKPLPAPPQEQAPAAPEIHPTQAVLNDALEQLRAAGMPEDQAQANAALMAARYETRAARLGGDRTALDLYKSEGLTIQRPEPEEEAPEGRAYQKTLFQAPVFYSAAERAIASSKQEKASPEQWLATIKNTPGVKGEELQWLGLEDWLKEQKGPVSKQAIADYVHANQIEVKEVEKGKGDFVSVAEHDFGEPVGDTTKFGSYTLPGGKNYRELLLTLPAKQHAPVQTISEALDLLARQEKTTPADIRERYGYLNENDYVDLANNPNRDVRGDTFKSAHWDEPNILAHVRFNDRVIDGKKTLFLEEIQSDWHQAGKRKGYDNPALRKQVEALVEEREQLAKTGGLLLGSPEREAASAKYEELTQRIVELNKQRPLTKGVPDAPFKTTWPELSLKRMIRYAAENGYDRIGWTPGEVQAERYDLSKQINRVVAEKLPDGRYTLEMFAKGGDPHGFKTAMDAEKLPDYVGKELAEKIVSDIRSAGGKTYSGLDLKVGGEGMKGFYDQILPAAANKLGKKFGAKVGAGEVPTDEPLQVYYGRQPSAAEIKSVRDLANSRDWTDKAKISPVTGERQEYQISRVAVAQSLSGVESAMRAGLSFSEAMVQEGSPELAQIFGGQLVPSLKQGPTHAIHTLDLTPQLRDAAVRQGFPLFQAGETAPRGRITLRENQAIIDLFANADASTFPHEAGHLYLEEMVRDATAENAPQGLKDDLHTIMQWLKVEKPEQIGTEQHEQWARGFEQYLSEGKAPSSKLADAFAKFKDWLLAIYHGLTSFGAPLSDDVRAVMDRMLATDEEIAAFRQAPPHPAEALADMPPAVQENAVQAAIADVIAGRPVRAGEMLEEAGKQDPRIAESLEPPAAKAPEPTPIATIARGRRGPRAAETARILEENHRHAEEELDLGLKEAEINPAEIPAERRARVLEIMTREGISDPIEAYERAVMEEDTGGVEAGQIEPAAEKIPGWDDVAEPTSGEGRAVAQEPVGEGEGGGLGPRTRSEDARAARQARGVADFRKFATDGRAVEEPDLAAESKIAEKTLEPPSVDVDKAVSAAQAAAGEADKLLADILPRMTDDERKIFEDALNQLDQDNDARKQMCIDGAECLAQAASG
jgi:hypothetical protein